MDNNLTKTGNSTSIGAILLDEGKISVADAERIIAVQKQKGLRFGDAAKELGLINDNDIQKALSCQFDYPYLTPDEEQFSWELTAAYQPFSKQVEAFRAIRGQLMLRWLDHHKTLSIVSAKREEGRSTMAANLAIVFSQLGERTLLIDADLRQPKQHQLFKISGEQGLSDWLAGRADKLAIKRIPAFRDLSVLVAGTMPPNPVELISRGLKNCLQQVQNDYDVILIDSPALEQGIDVQVIAACTGGSLLVARMHRSRFNSLQLLKESLQDTGVQCLGVVIANY